MCCCDVSNIRIVAIAANISCRIQKQNLVVEIFIATNIISRIQKKILVEISSRNQKLKLEAEDKSRTSEVSSRSEQQYFLDLRSS